MGFLTEEGPRPEFASEYGMRETESRSYVMRTKRNARDTDGTVWVEGPGGSVEDRGYVTTNRAATAARKPILVIPFSQSDIEAAAAIAAWAQQFSIRELNVAGPRASKWPGAEARAEAILQVLLATTEGY